MYKHDEIQKKEEEKEEEMSQFDYNPPSDTNQSHGKTIKHVSFQGRKHENY